MGFPRDADLDVTVRVYLGANPNDDPSTWPAPVEFTTADRVLRRPIQIRRGRGKNQRTAQAGSCTFWLDNTDGALTPLLPTSQYYPDWDLGVPCDLSVGGVGNAPPYTRHAGNVADVQALMVPGTGGLNISAVQVTSAGVLRRLGQGAVAKSALRRAYAGENLLAYWPMEEEGPSFQIASGISGGVPIPSTVELSFVTGQPGTQGALNLVNDTVVQIPVTIQLQDVAGFQIEYTGLSDQGAAPLVITVDPFTAGGVPFAVSVLAAEADGNPHHFAVRLVQNGGNVDATIYRGGIPGATTPLAGTLRNNPTIFLTLGTATTGTVTFSHLAVYAFADITDPIDRARAVDGYAGEQTHDRIERLCAQEGIPYSGNATESVECGPQPVGDIIAVLKDAEEVDHGMLVEDFAFGLNYLASSQRENLDPVITVDLSTYRTTSGTQGDVLTPVRNDARIRNEWTISRPNGSEATVNDPAHIARRGRYNDSASVNVEDDTRLPDEAGWRVHEGTFDGLRYDTVPLDLAANL